MKLLPLLILGCAFVLPLSASAQWQWIDKDGRKVFSDQPPPADLPEKNILKRAGSPPRVASAPATATPAADAATAPAAAARAAAPVPAKPAGVDKELEEKARKAEEAEKAKRAAEEQKVAQAKAENCQRARQGKATLDSGIRVARLNDKGEREIIDDKARASEQQRMQSVIDADCK
jgi:hypothetical protein